MHVKREKTADPLLPLGDLPQTAENRVGSVSRCSQHVLTKAILPALSNGGSLAVAPSTLGGELAPAPCPALIPPSSTLLWTESYVSSKFIC